MTRQRATPAEVSTPVWRVLSATDQPMSIADLSVAVGAARGAVQLRVARWTKAGYVQRLPGRPHRYRMAERAPALPPRIGATGVVVPPRVSGRQRMWTVIRVLQTFDLPSLMIAAGVVESTARNFVTKLVRAGFVTRASLRVPSQWATYRLKRPVGPRAPSIRHGERGGVPFVTLFDHNTGKSHDLTSAEGAVPASAGGGVG